MRLAAFSCFVCAAFAWPVPLIDRAGLAALGFGFVALALGRGSRVPRPSQSQADPLAGLLDLTEIADESAGTLERIRPYLSPQGAKR